MPKPPYFVFALRAKSVIRPLKFSYYFGKPQRIHLFLGETLPPLFRKYPSLPWVQQLPVQLSDSRMVVHKVS